MLQLAAWAFVVLAIVVLVTTFPGRGHIMVPSLLPVFGVLFALVFLLVQYAFAVWLRSWRAGGLVTGICLLGMGLGGCGAAMDLWGELAEHNVSAPRQVLVAGACASGLAVGMAVLRGWVRPKRPE